MTPPPLRIVVSFCDQWADPGPDGAIQDAWREALCTEIENVDPTQMPAWLVSRYVGEMDCGGHDQYFFNLHGDVAARIPGTIDGLHMLGLHHAAEILARAHARWVGTVRTLRTDIDGVSEMFQKEKFDDLDDEYCILGLADPADHPQSVFDTYMRENIDLFIELAPPTEADQALIALGDPRLHRDGGRQAWLSLAEHASPRVRLKAAQNILQTDRKMAIAIGKTVYADPSASDWVIGNAVHFLSDKGVSTNEFDQLRKQRQHKV